MAGKPSDRITTVYLIVNHRGDVRLAKTKLRGLAFNEARVKVVIRLPQPPPEVAVEIAMPPLQPPKATVDGTEVGTVELGPLGDGSGDDGP